MVTASAEFYAQKGELTESCTLEGTATQFFGTLLPPPPGGVYPIMLTLETSVSGSAAPGIPWDNPTAAAPSFAGSKMDQTHTCPLTSDLQVAPPGFPFAAYISEAKVRDTTAGPPPSGSYGGPSDSFTEYVYILGCQTEGQTLPPLFKVTGKYKAVVTCDDADDPVADAREHVEATPKPSTAVANAGAVANLPGANSSFPMP
jgi:hypothetical protein